MNNPTFKVIALFLGLLIFSSCSEDEDDKIKPVVEFPTEFSDLTAEENKANLEDNGIALLNHMNALKATAGIRTSVSFNHFLTLAELPATSSGRKATAVQPLSLIRSLANFGIGKESASSVLSNVRLQQTEPVTAQDAFNELVGVFAYDAAAASWTHTPGDDGRIVFQFPSTRGGTVNNAEYVIYGYTSVQIQNTEFAYTGDAPTAIKADLTVDGVKQIEYAFAASYKSNGEPTSLTSSLTISPFVFATEVTNTSTEVSINSSLKTGDTILIAIGASATGNFGSGNVEGSANVGAVLTESSAYFQIMGIKFSGKVDAKSLDDAMMAAETPEQRAAALNAHVKLVVFYADSKQKIAETEFYGVTETESGTNCWDVDTNGDGIVDGQDCQPWSYTNEYVDIRLIFADDSKADLEAYTNAGFEDFTREIEAFADAVEADLE